MPHVWYEPTHNNKSNRTNSKPTKERDKGDCGINLFLMLDLYKELKDGKVKNMKKKDIQGNFKLKVDLKNTEPMCKICEEEKLNEIINLINKEDK